MPIHDWTRVDAGLFHAFHQDWIGVLARAERRCVAGIRRARMSFDPSSKRPSKLIAQGIHLLVIDLFPPTNRDPRGIHKAIWDEFVEEDFDLPVDQNLILAAYDAGPPVVAYVEPIAVGESLPDMPVFLKPDFYVPAPLEQSYRLTWDEFFPAAMKRLLEDSAERGSVRAVALGMRLGIGLHDLVDGCAALSVEGARWGRGSAGMQRWSAFLRIDRDPVPFGRAQRTSFRGEV